MKLLTLLLILSFLSSWQLHGKDELPYGKLVWSNFRGKPDYSRSDIAAYTEWQWDYSCEDNNGAYTFSVKAFILPSQSWTKTSSAYILKHEQGHADIAEIYARQLDKAFKAIDGCRDCKAAADSMYEITYRAACQEQADYDSATDRSINREQQAEWSKKINLLLRKN